MQAAPKKPKQGNQTILVLIFLGFLVVFFAFGKSLVDLVVLPRTLDLAADDQIQAGFLPVYSEEGAIANPEAVAVSGAQPAQPFPTPQAGQPDAAPTADPGKIPDHIDIPSINLDASIVSIGFEQVSYEGEIYDQYLAPDFRAVGWQEPSVGLGVPGNTVLNGHHNIKGEVFRDLYQLQVGDEIDLYSQGEEFRYVVVHTAILPERNQPLEVRLANAQWIEPTEDERVTLITCWPYESNTHRVVVVAVPIRGEGNG